jgi:hypothetical protein
MNLTPMQQEIATQLHKLALAGNAADAVLIAHEANPEVTLDELLEFVKARVESELRKRNKLTTTKASV